MVRWMLEDLSVKGGGTTYRRGYFSAATRRAREPSNDIVATPRSPPGEMLHAA